MENVGAVSFNDQTLLMPKEETSDLLRSKLCYIALHELAHMWFGDLVTMKWWTDLWLKESFADFMAATCLMESSDLRDYKNPELAFVNFTHFALSEDIRSTTHPISVDVKHTIDAVNIFDRICYEKGASFIK
jgi:aminopeptidase N